MTTSSDDFNSLAISYQIHAAAASLPLSTPHALPSETPAKQPRPISSHAKITKLKTDDDWDSFHRSYTSGRHGNLKPWLRCLSLLRSMNACTAVRESYYVCLDYRSEYAAFYSHIDAPRTSHTTRLHFFSQEVSPEDVTDLNGEQIASYLGYMVCREGDLPLVGRTLIRTPPYIEESTAISEPVNFFGQKLLVRGVPFMQQDQRFAVCCHVAAWVLHYTAFRRGVQERRHIADLVDIAGPIHPLRPRAIDGLTESQVAQMLNELGFRTHIYHTPTAEISFHSLPEVLLGELPKNLLATLAEAKVRGPDSFDIIEADVLDRLEDGVGNYLQQIAKDSDLSAGDTSDTAVLNASNPYMRAFHELIDYLIRPYIRSGWPIYAGTRTHAFVICGRTGKSGKPIHFLHDDQNGPYLAAESLPNLSRDSLRYQAAGERGSTADIVPREDLVASQLEHGPAENGDVRRAVEALVIAVPSRVLLSPTAANRKSRRTIAIAQKQQTLLSHLSESDKIAFSARPESRVSIVMGIDYKIYRRHQAQGYSDATGIVIFSSLQLAEWVIVVEFIDEQGLCFAEFVYDASSSDDDPRTIFSRIFSATVAVYPGDDPGLEDGILASRRYSPLMIPDRIGKLFVDAEPASEGTEEIILHE
jgi:hypothetical protein